MLARVHTLGEPRSAELITDALSWAMVHFDELGYNCKTGKEKLQSMPNMIGFQSVSVLHGICSRPGSPNKKADIIVDQQSLFNTTQRELSQFYYQIREQPWILGPGLPVMDMKNMPAKPLVFQSGTKSAGLELVDIYLWIFKRFIEGKELTRPLARLVYTNQNTARTGSVSLQSVAKRFKEFFEKLPESTAERMKKANEYRDQEEATGTSDANPAAILIRQVEYAQKWKRPRWDDASVRYLRAGPRTVNLQTGFPGCSSNQGGLHSRRRFRPPRRWTF